MQTIEVVDEARELQISVQGLDEVIEPGKESQVAILVKDASGKPVRDVDFTDHGRPHNHLVPHQHEYGQNPTGGTRSRGKTMRPVEGWNY